jgi:hypothetical protein
MTEINITRFFADEDHFEYSASRAERGQNAGPETWANAKERAAEEPHLLTTDEAREAWRQDLHDMGFGDGEEITRDPAELEALFIQFVAGDIREMQSLCGDDWDEFEKLAERGTVGGRMCRGDDGEVYYYLGS